MWTYNRKWSTYVYIRLAEAFHPTPKSGWTANIHAQPASNWRTPVFEASTSSMHQDTPWSVRQAPGGELSVPRQGSNKKHHSGRRSKGSTIYTTISWYLLVVDSHSILGFLEMILRLYRKAWLFMFFGVKYYKFIAHVAHRHAHTS